MPREVTISVDEGVYENLAVMHDPQKIGDFISNLAHPYVYEDLEAGYRAMAADKEHESEAREWCNALIGDGL
ncbi:hypothetical protein FACS1894190_00200 [Spirochaetia bacterium]|nr:hypothetical protein FACS1894190_00200 [Spirochaetia bacterium]